MMLVHEHSSLRGDSPKMTLGWSLYLVARSVHTAANYEERVVSFSPFASPESAHVGIGRTALSDDPSVPPCIVVQVNHNVRPGGQGCVDEVVELSEETRGEGGRCLVVSNQSLPVDGKSDTIAPGQNGHDPVRRAELTDWRLC